MKLLQAALFTIVLSLPGIGSAALGQDSTRETLGLTYPEDTTISVKLEGTYRLPRASGEAKVERKKGMTEIEIELDEMKPAPFFGGDFNSYVLWVASPEGHVDNVGEFILEGNRSKLNVSTPLETFGLIVTAEPHFLVSTPSRFVVLENSRPANNIAPLKISRLKYSGFSGVYRFDNESLANLPETSGELRTHLEAARTAVDLAERAGAEEFAREQLENAREALRKAEAAQETGVGGRNQMLLGHEVIRLAVEAQKLAEKRSFEAALQAERDENAAEMAGLRQSIQEAETAAEKARFEARAKELQLSMEARAREKALEQARQAALRAARAEAEASEAKREREQARRQMREALSQIVEIRESARGLILNLPDILFDFNQSTLRPEARELLSKVAGILLVARGYLLSIEGHTDNVGSDDYNDKLSQERAISVKNYLAEAGLTERKILATGFGESRPIASNDNSDGRQQNRRVEIVIEETKSFALRDESSGQ